MERVVVAFISSMIQLLGYIALYKVEPMLCWAALLIHFGEHIDHRLQYGHIRYIRYTQEEEEDDGTDIIDTAG